MNENQVNENKNKILLVIVIITLLIVVLYFGVAAYKDKKVEPNQIKVNLSQIYVSDYEIMKFDKYFIETMDYKIYGILNAKGEEIYLNETGIVYDKIYKTREGQMVIYNIIEDKLNFYVFEGTKFEKQYTVEKGQNIKPLIIQENEDYLVGFIQENESGFALFNLENNIPVKVDNLKIVGDYYQNETYYINNLSLVVMDTESMYGVINLEGVQIIPCKYNNIISTVNGNYVVQAKNTKYGIISSEEELVKTKYEMIIPFKNNYLVVKQGKMALFDNNYANVTGFTLTYQEKDYDLRTSKVYSIKTLGNYKVIINKTTKKMIVLKNNKVFLDLPQEYTLVDDKIYVYNEQTISIYDSEFNKEKDIQLKEEIKNIKKIERVYDNLLKIKYENKAGKNEEVYYDFEGQKVDMKGRQFILQDSDYLLFVTKEDSENILEVISNKKEVLHTIKATKIKAYKDYIIADKSIYKITVNK